MTRKRNRWTVQLQDGRSGELKEVNFDAYWGPDNDFVTTESVAHAAAAREHVRAGGQSNEPCRFAGISATHKGHVGA